MKCPDDCPVLTDCERQVGSMLGRVADMMVELNKNQELVATNKATSDSLSNLPDIPEVIEARAILQEAETQAQQARDVA